MPKFSESILGNWKQIQDAFKIMQDVIVTDNYLKAYKDLEPYRKRKADRENFLTIAEKLKNADISGINRDKEMSIEGIDQNGYAYTRLPETQAYKNFITAYQRKNPGADPTKAIDLTEFNKYLDEVPEEREELRTTGIIRPMVQKVPKSDDEIRTEVYNRAGLSPEELQFYNDYKKNMIPSRESNFSLSKFVTERAPYLISTGEMGTTKLEQLGADAKGLMMQDPAGPNVKTTIEDGYLLAYDERGNLLKKTKIKEDGMGQLKQMPADKLKTLTLNDILSKYSTDDIYKHIDDFSEEIRNKLYEMYPNWKPEEDTLKTGRGSKGRKGGLGLGNPFGNNEEETPAEEETTDRKKRSGSITDQLVEDIIERNSEVTTTKKKRNRKALQSQRDEIAGYMKQFSEDYKMVKLSKNKNLQQKWLDGLKEFLTDVQEKFDPEVVEEAIAYVEKYYGIKISR